jgi:hypothetical protein
MHTEVPKRRVEVRAARKVRATKGSRSPASLGIFT